MDVVHDLAGGKKRCEVIGTEDAPLHSLVADTGEVDARQNVYIYLGKKGTEVPCPGTLENVQSC